MIFRGGRRIALLCQDIITNLTNPGLLTWSLNHNSVDPGLSKCLQEKTKDSLQATTF